MKPATPATTTTPAAKSRPGVKMVKYTVEIILATPLGSEFGGSSSKSLTRDEKYARFYLKAAMRYAGNGQVTKQEEIK
jgi:hypothetical protein